jgi:hypothetical protein
MNNNKQVEVIHLVDLEDSDKEVVLVDLKGFMINLDKEVAEVGNLEEVIYLKNLKSFSVVEVVEDKEEAAVSKVKGVKTYS